MPIENVVSDITIKNSKDISKLIHSVSRLERDVAIIKDDVTKLKTTVSDIKLKLWEHDKRFGVLEERTALIPKLYDSVDKLVGEILDNRQERAFFSNKLRGHETRITTLEKMMSS